jgi:hypothetical protein
MTKHNWPTLFPRATGLSIVEDEDLLEGDGAIGVLRLTGWPNSGKTSFIMRAITVRPDEDKAAPIVAWSFEDGVEPFAQIYKVDVHSMTQLTDHVKAIKEMQSQIEGIEPGQYAAALIDPAEDWEDWMTEYIMANPREFGVSQGQLVKDGRPSYLFWGILKNAEKAMLKNLLARVELVVVVNHLGQRFRGNEPVKGQFDPKGKKSLEQMATMTVYLIREPGERPPAGYITKSRLEVADWSERDKYGAPKKSRQLFPTLMPEFTPNAIRYWLEHPEEALNRPEEKPPSLWTLLNSPEEIVQMQEEALRQQIRLEEQRQQAQRKIEGERLVKEMVGEDRPFATVEELFAIGEALKAEDIHLGNTAYDVYKTIVLERKE